MFRDGANPGERERDCGPHGEGGVGVRLAQMVRGGGETGPHDEGGVGSEGERDCGPYGDACHGGEDCPAESIKIVSR